ncbi:MAG TPA: hypothetical protein VK011_05575 [Acidimicrobiia bacterium]|nr:hypothetical protein [Acidimicrobiia bacterium]
MRARWTFIGAMAVVAIALPAAGEVDLDPADRALIHSYSPEAMQLLWGTRDDSSTAQPCEIEEESVYTYTEEADGVVIRSADGEIVTDGCPLTATDVRGPNGQVNHGTVVSSFVHALKEAGYEGGIGCHVRAIARSDYGKGDQQVRTADAGSASPEVGEPEIEFEITETDCARPETEADTSSRSEGSAEEGAAEAAPAKGRANGKGEGKPDWAGTPGPPPHAKGRGRR